jgi:hypothetical protein
MIPQAIASCGPYADLWSHLKSMIHALERARTAKNTQELTALDKERLRDVVNLLKTELFHRSSEGNLDEFSSLTTASPFDPAYTLGIDLRQFLKEIPEFERWNSPQKLGADKKLQKLQSALENYLENLSANLLNTPPKEEFLLLQTILASILVHTESALQM